MTSDVEKADRATGAAGDGAPVSLTRRALMRGAAATVPTVLTLHSGAALARSSNLVGAGPNVAADGGKYRCLDTETVYRTENPNVYDLGDPPMAHVTTISSDAKYYRIEQDGWRVRLGDRVAPTTMCSQGGAYARVNYGWPQPVSVKPGVLVSATALSSFSGVIRYTDV